MIDNDYPSEETLERIKNWPQQLDTFAALLEEVKAAWWMPSWGWHEEDALDMLDRPIRRYSISTGGWSGNESLIGALQDNHMFWGLCWVQSRRGGHYIFEIRKDI